MFCRWIHDTATGLNSTRKKRLFQLFSHVCTITKTLIEVTAKFFSAPRSTFRWVIANRQRRRIRRHIVCITLHTQLSFVLFSFVRCPFISIACICKQDCRHHNLWLMIVNSWAWFFNTYFCLVKPMLVEAQMRFYEGFDSLAFRWPFRWHLASIRWHLWKLT